MPWLRHFLILCTKLFEIITSVKESSFKKFSIEQLRTIPGLLKGQGNEMDLSLLLVPYTHILK
jgi:hypothetical protein